MGARTPEQQQKLERALHKLEEEQPRLAHGKFILSDRDGSNRRYCLVGWLAHECGMTNLELRRAQDGGKTSTITAHVANCYGIGSHNVSSLMSINDSYSDTSRIWSEAARQLRTYAQEAR